jgi:hypothetical protein
VNVTVHTTGDKNDGINCDLCNITFVNKFEYYNAKFDLVVVDKDKCKSGIVNIDRRYLDLDICPKCMEQIIDKVKVVISDREGKKKDEKWTAKGD